MSLKEMSIAGRTFMVDSEKTEKVYSRIPEGVGCDCEPCQNYELVTPAAFTEELLAIFSRLGIHHTKPAEIYHSHQLESGLHHYAAWFHIIGSIGAQQDSKQDIEECNYESVAEHIRLGVTGRNDLANEEFGDAKLVQIDMEIELPWELAVTEPD